MFSWLLQRSHNERFNIFGSTFLAIFSNIFTIMIQIVAGHTLPLSALSAFLTVWTFYSLVALTTSGVQTSTAIQISRSESWRSKYVANNYSWFGLDQFTRKVSAIGIFGTLVFILLTPIVAEKLHIAPMLYVLACLSIVPQALFAIAVGRLQGRYEFLIMNVFGATSTLVRFATTVLVLQISPSAEAIIVANTAVTFVFSVACLINQKFNFIPDNRFSLWDAGRATAILIAFWIVFNLDMFLSRLAPQGPFYDGYAAASALARTILIPVVLLTAALIPKLASGAAHNMTTKNVVKRIHGINLILASFITLFIWSFSSQLTILFIGELNLEVVHILRLLSIAYLPYAIIYSMVNKNLALGIHVNFSLLGIPAILGICAFLILDVPIENLPLVIFVIGVLIICNIYFRSKSLSRISRFFVSD